MHPRTMIGLTTLLMADVALAADPAPAPPSGSESTTETPEETALRQQSAFVREMRTVEQDATRAKERVFSSKATLQLLKELILDGATTGSRVSVKHVNDLSGAYSLESVEYYLDGKRVFARTATDGELDREREFDIPTQALPPGDHRLEVNLIVSGSGFGVFSYLKNYSFRVQSTYPFTIEEGREVTLRVIAAEKGGIMRAFAERPTVEYALASERLKEESP